MSVPKRDRKRTVAKKKVAVKAAEKKTQIATRLKWVLGSLERFGGVFKKGRTYLKEAGLELKIIKAQLDGASIPWRKWLDKQRATNPAVPSQQHADDLIKFAITFDEHDGKPGLTSIKKCIRFVGKKCDEWGNDFPEVEEKQAADDVKKAAAPATIPFVGAGGAAIVEDDGMLEVDDNGNFVLREPVKPAVQAPTTLPMTAPATAPLEENDDEDCMGRACDLLDTVVEVAHHIHDVSTIQRLRDYLEEVTVHVNTLFMKARRAEREAV